jgi:hypothetical protein
VAYKDHPEFKPPESRIARIWRYMDLAKLLSLLEKSALFFVRVDKLASVDPFEGYYTTVNIQADSVRFEDMPQEWRDGTNIKDAETFKFVIDSNRRTREFVKMEREVTFVSSWYCQEHESAAMWNLYIKSQEGIAIESTYERLVNSFTQYVDFDIHVGMMKYIDYEREFIPIGNLLSPFMYKRKSFEHEHELRALIWTPQHGKNVLGDPSKNKFRDTAGIYVPVELKTLIGRVYLAPTAATWTLDLIRNVLKKYGVEAEVIQSDLASKPVY